MEKFKEITAFIRSQFNTPEDFIKLHQPRFMGNEKKYLLECIDSNYVSSVGKFVGRFEELIAEYTGAKYAVATVNGTAALHIALLLSDVKPDDEVITQSLTFVATANAISYTWAKPVFIDVDLDTMGLSPEALKNWLKENVEMKKFEAGKENDISSRVQPRPDLHAFNKSTGRRISACVPMHTFGHPCRIDEIVEICGNYNISVVEDAAESLGSFYKEKHTGTFGKFGILSFNGNKTITSGGGGMIITNDKKLAKTAKHITTTAKVPHKWDFNHDITAYNYRLTNLSAALGCAQIEKLPAFIDNKRELAKEYKSFFETLNLNFVSEPADSKSNYWLNTLILKNRKERDEFLEYMNEHGIMTRPVWQLMSRLEMYKECQSDNLINSKWLADRVVNIPSSVRI